MVMPYLWSVFLELVPSTFVFRCLLTPDCVSPNVMLLIQLNSTSSSTRLLRPSLWRGCINNLSLYFHKYSLKYTSTRYAPATDTFCIARVHCTDSGCGKKEGRTRIGRFRAWFRGKWMFPVPLGA